MKKEVNKMTKLTSEYDWLGNEYGIFYSEGTFYLFDCFDYTHDGEPIARGSYDEMHNKLNEMIVESFEGRFKKSRGRRLQPLFIARMRKGITEWLNKEREEK